MTTAKAQIIEADGCMVRVIHLDRVQKAKNNSVPDTDLDRLALTYKILGDPNRLKILIALKNAEMCVCDLAAFTCVSESAVSHQLRRMKDLSLVKSRRDGQIIYYTLTDEHVSELLDVGLAHISH
jgi:DNA-binding transcriptional ArsR family regulator